MHSQPADATGADATGADATGADATGADATGADATGADATGADATGADATGADATGADATGADATDVARASLLARGALAVIRFYQRFISPGLPPACRFYPSCSRYTYGAIERFGLARGLWLGCNRVCRCHPWNAGGIDEVPAQFPPPQAAIKRTVAKIKVLTRRRFDSPRN